MIRFAPILAALALPLMAGCVDTKANPDTGAEDYAAYCSACHGATGQGDGGMATELSRKPGDLTTLSARNKGAFPTTKVMAQIWGYAPIRLVQLAEYLKVLQAK